jgi:signal transduction histidine kinase
MRPQTIPTLSGRFSESKNTTKLSAFHPDIKKLKEPREEQLRRRSDSPFSQRKSAQGDCLESLYQESQDYSNRGKSSGSVKKINLIEAKESPGYVLNKKFTRNFPDKIIKENKSMLSSTQKSSTSLQSGSMGYVMNTNTFASLRFKNHLAESIKNFGARRTRKNPTTLVGNRKSPSDGNLGIPKNTDHADIPKHVQSVARNGFRRRSSLGHFHDKMQGGFPPICITEQIGAESDEGSPTVGEPPKFHPPKKSQFGTSETRYHSDQRVKSEDINNWDIKKMETPKIAISLSSIKEIPAEESYIRPLATQTPTQIPGPEEQNQPGTGARSELPIVEEVNE